MISKDSRIVLEAWQEYIKLNGVEKSKISASELHESQQLMLSAQDCDENERGVFITLPPATLAYLRKRFVKKDGKGNIEHIEPLQIMFPILRIKEKTRNQKHARFLPLFMAQLPESLFRDETTDKILLPVKDGLRVQAMPYAFREILNTDIAELGENRHMMSLVGALTSTKFESFFSAFSTLEEWLKSKLSNHHYAVPESGFNLLIAPLHNDDGQTKSDGKDYEALCDSDNNYDYPPLERYLTYSHDEQHPVHYRDVATCGLFEETWPLGHGQMQAIQAINQDELLVAVQGAPGTGKTTLFKSLIAQKIVERALRLINDDDVNLGMLVTSTAIKAVENIIDDLRQDPLTQDLNWLWFQAGSKEQINKELLRLDALLHSWQSEVYEEQRQTVHASVLKTGQAEILHCFTQYQDSVEQAKQALLSYPDLTAFQAYFEQRLQQLSTVANEHGLSSTASGLEHLTELLVQVEAHQESIAREYTKRIDAEKHAKALEATWPLPHSWNEIVQWMQASPLRSPLEQGYSSYPQTGLAALFARFFSARQMAIRQKLESFYPEEFHYFKLADQPHTVLAQLVTATNSLENNAELCAHLNTLQEPAPDPQHSAALDALREDVQAVIALQIQLETARQKANTLQTHFPEGSWCDILRQRFIKTHRSMFAASIGYLWQEQLKRKNELEEVLSHWRSLLGNGKAPKFYWWKDRFDQFYRLLSLVYPVMATTLVSARKAAGYQWLNDLNGHKPWHLALCDEAGMMSAESLVPLLSRCERAMVVGDPLQIEPIRNLSEAGQNQIREKYFAQDNTLFERVSPMTVTAYHRAAGTQSGQVSDIGNGIVLDEHRRCQTPIANLFCKLAGYRGISIETAPSKTRISEAFKEMGEHHLMFYSVEGQKGSAVNTNMDEVDAIEQLLDKLEDAGYDLTQDIGIVTPYSNQKMLLIQRLGKRLDHYSSPRIGTVHQFQGVGFEVIIYSPVIYHARDGEIFQNKAPNMLNVAVSRAKQQFIIVGNYQRLVKAGGYLKTLANAVAEDFLLEFGSQHPQFDTLQNSPHRLAYYHDCEHIAAFTAQAAMCEKELIVISPWIRYGEKGGFGQPPQLKLLAEAQRRGVNVKVYYGYYRQNYQNEDSEPALVAQYCELLGHDNVIRLPEGTHEKLIIIDGERVILGSWNWLSHGYRRHCEREEWQRLAIRRETSVELHDIDFINEYKNSHLI
ncbi:AAA domain-containing protein [Serratia marcescens]|uniref:AAA domain-containing protein n=1 Tax=Serratia TaxID=613 RepID=UPI0037017BAE